MGIRAWYRELNDPTLPSLQAQAASAEDVRTERFFDTSVGPLTVVLHRYGWASLVRFDPNGVPAMRAWSTMPSQFREAIAATGVPEAEAETIATVLATLEPPRPAAPTARERRVELTKAVWGLSWRWALGVFALERLLSRRRR